MEYEFDYSRKTSSYRFFYDLIFDITEDYRINQNKKYDFDKTIKKLYEDDDLWQQLNDSVWKNLVEIKEKESDK